MGIMRDFLRASRAASGEIDSRGRWVDVIPRPSARRNHNGTDSKPITVRIEGMTFKISDTDAVRLCTELQAALSP